MALKGEEEVKAPEKAAQNRTSGGQGSWEGWDQGRAADRMMCSLGGGDQGDRDVRGCGFRPDSLWDLGT